jgi:G3E family GTPase
MTEIPAAPDLPVTLIGGYLGAGKTTLINHLLRQADGLRLAVLVNDFGELPIDADLIEDRDDNVISIAGGCVCCSYGSDLMAALVDLDKLVPRPHHLLIETSGVALPVAIAQSVQLIAGYAFDGIVVVADAENILERGQDRYLGDTIERQLVAADIVLLNKTELVRPEELADTRRWLAEKAPISRVVETVRADIPLPTLLGIGSDQLNGNDREPQNHHHASHEAAVFSVDHAIDPERLAEMLIDPELDLIRTKGFVFSSDGRLRALQIVGRRWQVTDAPATASGPGRIVCIRHRGRVDAGAVSRIIAAC